MLVWIGPHGGFHALQEDGRAVRRGRGLVRVLRITCCWKCRLSEHTVWAYGRDVRSLAEFGRPGTPGEATHADLRRQPANLTTLGCGARSPAGRRPDLLRVGVRARVVPNPAALLGSPKPVNRLRPF
jgi:hypothetical protein